MAINKTYNISFIIPIFLLFFPDFVFFYMAFMQAWQNYNLTVKMFQKKGIDK